MENKVSTCVRCGRKLKDAKSIDREMGPVCYQKYLREQADIGFEEDQMSIEEIA